MPFMDWSDKLSVGVAVLDEDHKHLVALANQLHAGILDGHGKEALEVVLGELASYIQFHFAREEQMFAESGYPLSEEHRQEHEQLARRVVNLQARYAQGALPSLSIETMNFLRGWLLVHIQGSDKKYGPHLNANGIH